jgi:hypothetical protein
MKQSSLEYVVRSRLRPRAPAVALPIVISLVLAGMTDRGAAAPPIDPEGDAITKATNPSPVNGAVGVSPTVTLKWTPGTGVDAHDVYLGTTANAVNAATRTSAEYRGRFGSAAYAAAGILGGGRTYYWRIDEIVGTNVITGSVWSVTTAANPNPGPAGGFWPFNGQKHISLQPQLTWTAGAGATSHNVYLGTSYVAVLGATPESAAFQGSRSVTNFTPAAPLEEQRAYFWRIDGVGPGGTTVGPVNLFKTRPPPLAAPIISPEYEITDFSRGHTVGNAPNPECSDMVRVDSALYFLYRIPTPQMLFVRRFDLTTNTFGIPVAVDWPTDYAGNGYHSEPTLLRDGAGRLHVFNHWAAMISQCVGSYGTAPRYRRVPDLAKEANWSEQGKCLPSRFQTTRPNQYYDIMGVYDSREGVSHCVGQSYGLGGLDGRPNDGFSRTYYRIWPTGAVDGPYIVVESATGWIPELPTGVSAAIHAKGDLMIGREPSGLRSLHVMWSIRATWNDGNVARQCNANLYYARSLDGGNTWTNAAGTAVVPLLQHIQLNDTRFLCYSGDVDQDSERSFDVDSRSRPVIVFKRHRPGTGVLIGNRIDVLASPPPAYDLLWRRWTGSHWVGGVINNTTNWVASRSKVRVDLDDNIYAFAGDLPFYYVSKNGGVNWSGPITFGTQLTNSRLYSYPDFIDPNYHVIAYTDRTTWRRYFLRMQLTYP